MTPFYFSFLQTKGGELSVWRSVYRTIKLQEIERFKLQHEISCRFEIRYRWIWKRIFFFWKWHLLIFFSLQSKHIKSLAWRSDHGSRKLQGINCFKPQCEIFCHFEVTSRWNLVWNFLSQKWHLHIFPFLQNKQIGFSV